MMASSLSSAPMESSSSELLESESEASIFMLPSEEETAVLSAPWPPHPMLGIFGESRFIELRALRLRYRLKGIGMPFWLMVGEESGVDCSARVE
jgi:hypothetical protein